MLANNGPQQHFKPSSILEDGIHNIMHNSLDFIDQFKLLDKDNRGYLDGNQAKDYFELQHISENDLELILGSVNDGSQSGHLTMEQFVIAMHLSLLRGDRTTLPKSNSSSTGQLNNDVGSHSSEFSTLLRHCEEAMKQVEKDKSSSVSSFSASRDKLSDAFSKLQENTKQFLDSLDQQIKSRQSNLPQNNLGESALHDSDTPAKSRSLNFRSPDDEYASTLDSYISAIPSPPSKSTNLGLRGRPVAEIMPGSFVFDNYESEDDTAPSDFQANDSANATVNLTMNSAPLLPPRRNIRTLERTASLKYTIDYHDEHYASNNRNEKEPALNKSSFTTPTPHLRKSAKERSMSGSIDDNNSFASSKDSTNKDSVSCNESYRSNVINSLRNAGAVDQFLPEHEDLEDQKKKETEVLNDDDHHKFNAEDLAKPVVIAATTTGANIWGAKSFDFSPIAKENTTDNLSTSLSDQAPADKQALAVTGRTEVISTGSADVISVDFTDVIPSGARDISPTSTDRDVPSSSANAASSSLSQSSGKSAGANFGPSFLQDSQDDASTLTLKSQASILADSEEPPHKKSRADDFKHEANLGLFDNKNVSAGGITTADAAGIAAIGKDSNHDQENTTSAEAIKINYINSATPETEVDENATADATLHSNSVFEKEEPISRIELFCAPSFSSDVSETLGNRDTTTGSSKNISPSKVAQEYKSPAQESSLLANPNQLAGDASVIAGSNTKPLERSVFSSNSANTATSQLRNSIVASELEDKEDPNDNSYPSKGAPGDDIDSHSLSSTISKIGAGAAGIAGIAGLVGIPNSPKRGTRGLDMNTEINNDISNFTETASDNKFDVNQAQYDKDKDITSDDVVDVGESEGSSKPGTESWTGKISSALSDTIKPSAVKSTNSYATPTRSRDIDNGDDDGDSCYSSKLPPSVDFVVSDVQHDEIYSPIESTYSASMATGNADSDNDSSNFNPIETPIESEKSPRDLGNNFFTGKESSANVDSVKEATNSLTDEIPSADDNNVISSEALSGIADKVEKDLHDGVIPSPSAAPASSDVKVLVDQDKSLPKTINDNVAIETSNNDNASPAAVDQEHISSGVTDSNLSGNEDLDTNKDDEDMVYHDTISDFETPGYIATGTLAIPAIGSIIAGGRGDYGSSSDNTSVYSDDASGAISPPPSLSSEVNNSFSSPGGRRSLGFSNNFFSRNKKDSSDKPKESNLGDSGLSTDHSREINASTDLPKASLDGVSNNLNELQSDINSKINSFNIPNLDVDTSATENPGSVVSRDISGDMNIPSSSKFSNSLGKISAGLGELKTGIDTNINSVKAPEIDTDISTFADLDPELSRDIDADTSNVFKHGFSASLTGMNNKLDTSNDVDGPKSDINAFSSNIDAPKLDVDIPKTDVDSGISRDIKTTSSSGISAGFGELKTALDAKIDSINAPKLDTNISASGDLDTDLARNVDVDSSNTGVNSPHINTNTPKFDTEAVKADIEVPRVGVDTPKLNINAPKANIDTSISGDVNAPSASGFSASMGKISAGFGELKSDVGAKIDASKADISADLSGDTNTPPSSSISASIGKISAGFGELKSDIDAKIDSFNDPKVDTDVSTSAPKAEIDIPGVHAGMANTSVNVPKVSSKLIGSTDTDAPVAPPRSNFSFGKISTGLNEFRSDVTDKLNSITTPKTSVPSTDFNASGSISSRGIDADISDSLDNIDSSTPSNADVPTVHANITTAPGAPPRSDKLSFNLGGLKKADSEDVDVKPITVTKSLKNDEETDKEGNSSSFGFTAALGKISSTISGLMSEEETPMHVDPPSKDRLDDRSFGYTTNTVPDKDVPKTHASLDLKAPKFNPNSLAKEEDLDTGDDKVKGRLSRSLGILRSQPKIANDEAIVDAPSPSDENKEDNSFGNLMNKVDAGVIGAATAAGITKHTTNEDNTAAESTRRQISANLPVRDSSLADKHHSDISTDSRFIELDHDAHMDLAAPRLDTISNPKVLPSIDASASTKRSSKIDKIQALESDIEEQLDDMSSSTHHYNTEGPKVPSHNHAVVVPLTGGSSIHIEPHTEPIGLKSSSFSDKSAADAIKSAINKLTTRINLSHRSMIGEDERVLKVRKGFENFNGFGVKCVSNERPSSI